MAMLLMPGASGAGAPEFERVVVFGDSLSDAGNAGRFSDGPVWVEQLAERLGLLLRPALFGGTNFAVGGARLDPRSGFYNLRAQADLFLGLGMPPGRTLHIVYGGGNDVLAAIGAHDGERVLDVAVASLKGIVTDLAGRGATDVLVPNLPDVGMAPRVRAWGRRAVEEAGGLTARFNAALDRLLAGFGGCPGLSLHRLDVHAMAQRVRAEPGTSGFADVANPCRPGPCEGHLFWDEIHPTALAHSRLADAAFRVLAASV